MGCLSMQMLCNFFQLLLSFLAAFSPLQYRTAQWTANRNSINDCIIYRKVTIDFLSIKYWFTSSASSNRARHNELSSLITPTMAHLPRYRIHNHTLARRRRHLQPHLPFPKKLFIQFATETPERTNDSNVGNRKAGTWKSNSLLILCCWLNNVALVVG